MEGILIRQEKPEFHSAMARARAMVSEPYCPPLTQREVFSVYRQCRDSGNVFLRCSIGAALRTTD